MLKNLNAIRLIPMCVLTVVLSLVTACASGGSTASNGGSSTITAPQPTTVKTKPQSMVKVDQALCDRILSLTEAGQITQTTVMNDRVITTAAGGSCNYETAPYKAVAVVTFSPGGITLLQGIQTALQNQPDFKGSITPITGLGDAAIAVVNPLTVGLIQYRVIVAYGVVLINCVLPNSAAGDSTSISQLKQIAQKVVDRL